MSRIPNRSLMGTRSGLTQTSLSPRTSRVTLRARVSMRSTYCCKTPSVSSRRKISTTSWTSRRATRVRFSAVEIPAETPPIAGCFKLGADDDDSKSRRYGIDYPRHGRSRRRAALGQFSFSSEATALMRSGNGMEPRNRMREAHATRGTQTRQEEDAYLELRSNEQVESADRCDESSQFHCQPLRRAVDFCNFCSSQ